MAPFECYKTYLALKNHFNKDSYDYFTYNKKQEQVFNPSIKEKIVSGLKNYPDKETKKRLKTFLYLILFPVMILRLCGLVRL